MRKDPKSEQLLSPFMSSVSVWNQISDHETTSHTPQSTNLFSQKFKESISSQDFEVGCPYHQQKKAKYILIRDDGHQEKLCTKCAVVYAQQGLRVEEMHEDDVRKKQTDSFILQLQDTKQQVDQVCLNMTRTESNIKQFYNDQYTQVVKTFSDVEKALQICKSQILQNLSQVMWQAIQITNQLRVQSKSIEHQISTYISDIRANYENIVHHMGTLPFNQIMGGYGSKLFKLQQCIKQLEDKQIPYLQFEGKETCLQNFIQEISRLREIHQPEDSFQQVKHHRKESTRSSSEQRQQRSSEKEKRHQSQPNRDHNINVQENSEKKNQTFKITEESIEEWMENSSTKQRQSKNLQTEPSENCHYSPNILASKFIKTSKPQRSLKQDTSQQLMDRLLEGFNQIKKERDHKKHIITKKMSKTPELAKTVQTSIQSKLAPKFLFKNYYK